MSIKQALTRMMLRPGFLHSLESWKGRKVPKDYVADVFDGSAWRRDFVVRADTEGYLPLCLMINVDWFQPFERGTYSMGAVYAVVLNLPRDQRFLRQNLILLTLLPGREKLVDMNKVLSPIVSELSDLWAGIQVDLGSGVKKKVILPHRLRYISISMHRPRRLRHNTLSPVSDQSHVIYVYSAHPTLNVNTPFSPPIIFRLLIITIVMDV